MAHPTRTASPALSGELAPDGHQVSTPVEVRFGDLTKRELAVLTPLVVLIIFLGLYPKPVLDVINPTAQRTVVQSCHSDPAPSAAGSAQPAGAATTTTEGSCQ